MSFEWDEDKNQTNIGKHGVSLSVASRIFEGPTLSWTDTRRDYGERRDISIGKVGGTVFLAVVHTNRNGNVRLISARPASRAERRLYEQAL